MLVTGMNISFRTIILLILSGVGTFAILYSYSYAVPDLLEARYGFPLTWGWHIMNTIAGPTDVWRVDLLSLGLDAAIWFLILTMASALINYRRGKPKVAKAEKQP